MKDIDRGWKHIVREMEKLDGRVIHAGLFRGKKHKSPENRKGRKRLPDMVDIGVWNEYGAHPHVSDAIRPYFHKMGFHLKKSTTTLTIPSRPFMRTSADDKGNEWQEKAAELIGAVTDGKMTTPAALNALGEAVKAGIQDTIITGDYKDNHPFTISQKESTNTLVASGQLQLAIDFKIKRKGGE